MLRVTAWTRRWLKKNEHRDLEGAESRLGGEIAELERRVEAAERALEARLRVERSERRREALQALLGAPTRLWRALRAKSEASPPEAPPKRPTAPASTALREALEGLRAERAAEEAKRAARREQQAREEERLERILPALRELDEALTRAKVDQEVSSILKAHGVLGSTFPRTEIVGRTGWQRAQREIADLDTSRGQPAPLPASPPEQPKPQAPRKGRSGPSGP